MTRIRGTLRGALVLTLGLGAGSVKAQTQPALNLPIPASTVPAGTLGIADAGGLGLAGILPPGGVAAFRGTIRTGGPTNPGGLSFGGGGGSRGLAAIPGTNLRPNLGTSTTVGGGSGLGAGMSGSGLASDLDTGLTTGSIGGASGGTGAGIGTRSGVLDPNRFSTGGAGGAPAGAGTAGAPSAVDAYTDPFNGRGMP